MLTQEMFLALLQGLPADDLSYLDQPWYLLALRIQRGLKEGLAPPAALHAALDNSPEADRQSHLRAFLQESSVDGLDLSPRQKDALVALRYAGSCSLAQLSRILMRDPSNTRRTLQVLVEKGYAIKYFRKDGPAYSAVTSPLSEKHRAEAIEILLAYKAFLITEYSPVSSPQDSRSTATTETKPTKQTMATTLTMSPTLNTSQGDVPYSTEPGASPLLRRKGTSNPTGAFPVATTPTSKPINNSDKSNHHPRPP
jgi:DNA-binding MarR family transcriptional regulator